jgi:hypothetical protein
MVTGGLRRSQESRRQALRRPALVLAFPHLLDDFPGESLEAAGLREVMTPLSVTTSLSSHLAPTFVTSVLIEW